MELETIVATQHILNESEFFVRTPSLQDVGHLFNVAQGKSCRTFSLKLENMQNFGSFKIRGAINQFHHAPEAVKRGQQQLVTMSAGNYGAAFTELCSSLKIRGRVILPDFAPANRGELIRSKGLDAEYVPNDQLMPRVNECVSDGFLFMHPYDDPLLFGGYGVCGLEIFEDAPDTDVIVCCCGGGGFLAGVAAAAKLKSPQCKVYGVEPSTADTMYRSFEANKPIGITGAKSIASGLAPPYAGKHTYAVCCKTVDGILLVTDDEIRAAVTQLYNRGLVVEPAGAAAFAAYMSDKVPDISGKNVTVILTGRNVTPAHLDGIINPSSED